MNSTRWYKRPTVILGAALAVALCGWSIAQAVPGAPSSATPDLEGPPPPPPPDAQDRPLSTPEQFGNGDYSRDPGAGRFGPPPGAGRWDADRPGPRGYGRGPGGRFDRDPGGEFAEPPEWQGRGYGPRHGGPGGPAAGRWDAGRPGPHGYGQGPGPREFCQGPGPRDGFGPGRGQGRWDETGMGGPGPRGYGHGPGARGYGHGPGPRDGFGPGRGQGRWDEADMRGPGPRGMMGRRDPEEMFKTIDADGNGTISHEEFRAVHEKMRPGPPTGGPRSAQPDRPTGPPPAP